MELQEHEFDSSLASLQTSIPDVTYGMPSPWNIHRARSVDPHFPSEIITDQDQSSEQHDHPVFLHLPELYLSSKHNN
jgi:hypothetical protein